MNDTDKTNQLLQLRESIFQGIMPLIDESDIDPDQRFDLYSRLAQSRGTFDLYEKAFRAAQSLEQNSDKLRAYLELLADIDEEIQTDIPPSGVQQSQETPAQADNTI